MKPSTTRSAVRAVALSASLLVSGLALAACESDASVSEPRTTPYEHPTGADDVVLRIDSGGGLSSYDDAFVTQVPRVVVTGDGRVLRPTAPTGELPADGPTVVPFEAARVDEAVVQDLLAAADAAGLLDEPPEYEDPQVLDASGTSVVVAGDGEVRVHDAYALGLVDETGARARLAGFVDDALETLEAAADGPAEPYVSERLRITANADFPAPDAAAPPAWTGPDLTDTDCQVVASDGVPLASWTGPPPGSSARTARRTGSAWPWCCRVTGPIRASCGDPGDLVSGCAGSP